MTKEELIKLVKEYFGGAMADLHEIHGIDIDKEYEKFADKVMAKIAKPPIHLNQL